MRQRLGLAAALLGDPPVLVCDEPVNGLDPEGILWIRTLLRGLAAEGRTVLVSSHLMSEMALTADHLIIIGRGRLLADEPAQDFIARNSRPSLLVRSSGRDRLAAALRSVGAEVTISGEDDLLEVAGIDRIAVGDLAAREHLAIHELTARRASLESAYMDLTRDHADFAAGGESGTGSSERGDA
jgi:ABC-2 type transport system ATP-binding protein